MNFDLQQAKRFLTRLAEGEGRFTTFQTFDDRIKGKRRELARVIPASRTVLKELARLNSQGAGCFVCVNRTDGTGRKAENITAVRSLFVDLDGAPLEPLMSCPLEPHVIVASSPGRWHGYWLVRDCPLEKFTPAQLALASLFHGDPDVSDPPRVMRLPGSINHKHGEPFPVHIIEESVTQAYSIGQVIQTLKLDLTARRANGEDTSDDAYKRIIHGGGDDRHKVHDALRTLAARYVKRGMVPAEIIAALGALMDAAPWRNHADPEQRQRWQERRDEIAGLVAGAGKKYTPAAPPSGVLRSSLANAIDACAELLAESGLQIYFSMFFGARFGQNNSEAPYRWQDHHDLDIANAVQRRPAFARISVEHIRQALEAIAHQAPRDEMTDWLDSLSWDGVERLDYMAADAFGTEDELARRALKNHMVACGARQYRPGTKYDHMLILEGEQGTKKSTAITALFGADYVSEISSEPTGRDALLFLRGKLVADLTELSAMRRADLERFKAWITLPVDEYRAPYARLPVLAPRRFVLMGTTNEYQYLTDTTGNRRFLPVRCGEINLEYLRENREQLFAEAVVAYRDGYAFHELPIGKARDAQDARVLTDPWSPILAKALIGKTETWVGHCLNALDIPNKDRTRLVEQRVVGCLRGLGWRLGPRRRHEGAPVQFWVRDG